MAGLLGHALTLQLGAEVLPASTDGTFVFPTALASGTAYAVTVACQLTQPTQVCSIAAGVGEISDHAIFDIFDIAVTCAAPVPHLLLTIDSVSEYLNYGKTANYGVTLPNDGEGAATSASLDRSLSMAFDRDYAQWQCLSGGAGAICTAAVSCMLRDAMTLPSHRSLTWHLSAPVRKDAVDPEATLAVTVTGATPEVASTTAALVIPCDGLDGPTPPPQIPMPRTAVQQREACAMTPSPCRHRPVPA